jgi:peptidyl-prolyl cis-trans isomerase SurA
MSPRIWPAHAAAVRVASVLLAGAFVVLAADRPDPPKVVEEIVAKVNGDIITRGELEKDKMEFARQLQQQGVSGLELDRQVAKAGSDALSNQIDQLLLVQKAKDLNLNVDADLNREIAEIQSQSKISDPEKFHDWVREQSGMSFEDFRLQRKNKLLTDRVLGEEVWRSIVIPEADMRKYYEVHKSEFVRQESVTLREILVSTGDGKPATVAAAEKKAKALLERARGSADKFSDLARQNSDDASAADDGLLPPFERGKLKKAIEDVVFKHEKGYVTDLIRTDAGFMIMKVEEHVPEGQASFDEVKGEIANILSRPIADPKLRAYLTNLRKNAFLQIKEGYVDSAAAPGKDTTWKDPAQLAPETTTKAAVANRRHMKKLLGVVPYGYTGVKDTAPAAPPTATPVSQTPAPNADGTPR